LQKLIKLKPAQKQNKKSFFASLAGDYWQIWTGPALFDSTVKNLKKVYLPKMV
jgi:predicted house-cleaning NTP pyrophosphatase (Maf/HAM1 superfamily)